MNKWQRKFIKVKIDKPDETEVFRFERYKRHRELWNCLDSSSLWVVNRGIKLLRKQEDPSTVDSKINDHLLRSFKGPNTDFERVKLFVKHGASLPTNPRFASKCVHAPVEVLRYLFDECEMEDRDFSERLLQEASEARRIDIVEYLLKEDKCDVSWFNKTPPKNFIPLGGSFQEILPLLEEKGFDFDRCKTDILICGLANRCGPLIRYVLDRFTPYEKENLHIDRFDSIGGSTSDLLDLLDKYDIRPRDCEFHCAVAAAEKKDIETLEKLVNQGQIHINANQSQILRKAFQTESRSFVDKVYELGGYFKHGNHLPVSLAVEMSSYPFLDNVSKLDNSDEIFDKVLDIAIEKSSQRYAGYIKHTLDLWKDCPAHKMDSLFNAAVYKNDIATIRVLVDSGLDLKKLNNQTVYNVVSKADGCLFVDQLKDMGLNIERNLEPLINRCGNNEKENGIYNYLQGLKVDQAAKNYPCWEKQDDNTIAELSFVRRTSQDGFLRLRRAFNFRAGVVDQSYETYCKDNVVDFKPADTLPMSTLSPDMINRARQALEDRDGSATMAAPQREEKKLKTLRPRHN
ncbi:MAG: hypothetical protein ACQEQL_05980 [Pseudomonadota bacterium]